MIWYPRCLSYQCWWVGRSLYHRHWMPFLPSSLKIVESLMRGSIGPRDLWSLHHPVSWFQMKYGISQQEEEPPCPWKWCHVTTLTIDAIEKPLPSFITEDCWVPCLSCKALYDFLKFFVDFTKPSSTYRIQVSLVLSKIYSLIAQMVCSIFNYLQQIGDRASWTSVCMIMWFL